MAIVSTPNVGKSSLFNALLNVNRAIVTPIPGTTRDLLTERADIRGISASLVDTAGIRESGDIVEQEGVTRARSAVHVADLTLVVLDRSRPLEEDDRNILAATAAQSRMVVINKVDLPAAWSASEISRDGAKDLSMGLDALTGYTIVNAKSREDAERLAEGNPFISSIRIYEIATH